MKPRLLKVGREAVRMRMEMADVYGVKTRGQGDACAFFTQRETRGDVMPARTRHKQRRKMKMKNLKKERKKRISENVTILL